MARSARRPAVRLGTALGALALGLCACSGSDGSGSDGSGSALSAPVVSPVTPSPTGTSAAPASPSATSSTASSNSGPTPRATGTSTVATHLDVPWAVAFLPDGSALVTLRDQAACCRSATAGPRSTSAAISGVEPRRRGRAARGRRVTAASRSDRSVFVYFTAAHDNRVAAR